MKEYLKMAWENHSDQVITVGYNTLLVLAVLVSAFIISKLVQRWIRKTNDRFERFDETLVPILCTAGSLLVYTVGLIIILDFFGVNTSSILALLGAAGLAVALALKDTLGNIAAGMMLLTLRPFKTGDAIEAGSIMGKVQNVGLFTTIIETPDGIYISAPNSSLWGSPIRNFMRNGKRRMEIIVGISYDDSIDKGFEVLQKIISSEERFLEEPAPQMMVKNMGDSSIDLQLRAWAPVDVYWDVYWDNNKKVKEQIEAAGLTIPFPQRDVHLINASKSA